MLTLCCIKASIEDVPQNNKTPAGEPQPTNNINTDITPDIMRVCLRCLGSPPCCCKIIGKNVAPANIKIKITYGIKGKYPISSTWFHISAGELTRFGTKL